MKLTIKVEGKSFEVEIADPTASPMVVTVDGTEFSVEGNDVATSAPTPKKVEKKAVDAKPAAGAETVKAPIPGVIQEIAVKSGQTVKKGDVLFVLEAMKMKNNIVANRDGKIAEVYISKGDTVTHGQALLSYAE